MGYLGKFKKEDLKVGDYGYYTIGGDMYNVVKIIKIKKSFFSRSVVVRGYWNKDYIQKLPQTFEEFNSIEKDIFDCNANLDNVQFVFKKLYLREVAIPITIKHLFPLTSTIVPKVIKPEILHGEGVSTAFDSATSSDKFSNLENYESSTIMALNEALEDGCDAETILRILSPNITKIAYK